MDLCFSGYSLLSFRKAVTQLSRAVGAWNPTMMLTWDEEGVNNELSFGAGTAIEDAFRINDFDHQSIQRITYCIPSKNRRHNKCTVELYRCHSNATVTGIGGLLFNSSDDDDGLTQIRADQLIQSLLYELSECLSAVVTVSDEDDPSLIVCPRPLVLIPVVCAAVGWPLQKVFFNELASSGVLVNTDRSGTLLVIEGSVAAQSDVKQCLRRWLESDIQLLAGELL